MAPAAWRNAYMGAPGEEGSHAGSSMREATRTRSLATVVVLLLVATAGAGCLESIGNATKNAIGPQQAAPSSSEAEPAAAGSSRDETSVGTGAIGTYEAAMSKLEGDDDAVERYAIEAHIEALEGDRSGDARIFLDKSQDLQIISFSPSLFGNGTTANPASGPGAASAGAPPDALIMAQAGKTSLFGSPKGFIGDHDENRSAPEQLFQPNESSFPGAGNSSNRSLISPGALLDAARSADGFETTVERTSWEGRSSIRVDLHKENRTHELDVSAWILTATERPVHFEVTERNRSATDPLERGSHTVMNLSYGRDASHPYETEVRRASSMVLNGTSPDVEVTAEDLGSSRSVSAWEVAPSPNSGLVALEEATLLVKASSDDGSDGLTDAAGQVILELPADEGSASNGSVNVSYVDVDGDGAVSTGDRIELEAQNVSAGPYSVVLQDEKTGVKVMPATGLVGLLAVLGLAALALRRR